MNFDSHIKAREIFQQELFRNYIPLSEKYAKYYYRKSPIGYIELEDLKQEALDGLWKAVKTYNGSTKFVTWAPHWIRQRIIRYIANSRSMIREPVHIYEKRRKNKNIPLSSFRIYKTRFRGYSNLDFEDRRLDVIDIIPFDAKIEKNLEKKQIIIVLKKVIKTLPKRTQRILKMYFWEQKTYQQIGDLLGVSRERIRQIISFETLPKIKEQFLCKNLV